MNNIRVSNRGFSLLEVVISLGIFSFLILAVTSLALGSFSFFTYSQSLERAEILAHEGIEAVKSISSEKWNELKILQSGIDFASGRWSFAGEGTTEQLDAFQRVISLSPVYRDADGSVVASTTPDAHVDVLSKMVSVVISWNSDRDMPQTLIKTFLLTAWKVSSWIQNDWTGVGGQTIDIDHVGYDSSDNIATASSSLSLSKVSILVSAFVDYASTSEYSFDSEMIIVDGQASLVATTTSGNAVFPIDEPTVELVKPVQPNQLYAWYSFGETATKNSGEIYYQLSQDGSSWFYWDGSAWSLTTSDHNTAVEVNKQISKFPTATKQLYIKAFLASGNNEQVSLDGIKVMYLSIPPPAWGYDIPEVYNVQGIYGDQMMAERFVYQGSDKKIIGFSVYVHKASTDEPADDLFFSLQDVDTNTEVASGTMLYKNLASTMYSWSNVFLKNDLSLEDGKAYRLQFYSHGSAADNPYEIYTIKTGNIVIINDASFTDLDTQLDYSNTGGADWVASTSDNVAFKILYNMSLIGGAYEKTGYLISSAYHVPSGIFYSIDWRGDSPCPDCSIKAWIKTAPDNGGVPGAWDAYWAGPNGKDADEGDYFTNNYGTLIDATHNGDQWVKYKIELSGNGENTPSLNSIRINHK